MPENLIKQEIDLMSKGQNKTDEEKNKKENEKIAKKRIKLGLILNEIGEKNKLKVGDEEIKNEIQKQVQSMPGQQNQVLEYYKNNPAATSSLRGTLYEEKIINLIKSQSKLTKKQISLKEADDLLEASFEQKHSNPALKKTESKKAKKTIKSSEKSKKIRKK